ncbi:MAG: aspartate 1-decarboxylase [Bacteroidetes bacterium QS_9_68_14]|nr:MAG: aspartate 1-decarboxylase [Bacteroidetes bacterium QS_9_68_14]
MTVTMFRAKLHRLRVTEADLDYEGSITIDEELLDAAGILPHEQVQVVNVNNGRRLWTYTIPAAPGSRTVCLNGPAARLAAPGDPIIAIAYAEMTPQEAEHHEATAALVGEGNEVDEVLALSAEERAHPENLPEDVAEGAVVA